MQVSGFRVSYKLTDAQQLVLDKVEVNCTRGWQSISSDATYLVVLNNFIANGGDGYSMIKPENYTDYMFIDSDIFTKYIGQVKNATTLIENRLQIVGKSSAAARLLQINMVVVLLIHFVWNKRI